MTVLRVLEEALKTVNDSSEGPGGPEALKTVNDSSGGPEALKTVTDS